MKRRTFLAGLGAFTVTLGGGVAVWSRFPVIPQRPEPDLETALGWISHRDGVFELVLPRIEIGQNISTALKQIACQELGAAWDDVTVTSQRTQGFSRVRSTVGSESVRHFAKLLAQACATLRDALAAGQTEGRLEAVARPVAELRSFRKGAFVGSGPELADGREIVTGAPLYAADMRLDGMVYGRVIRALATPEITSRPKQYDVEAAKAVPGFNAVIEDPLFTTGGSRGLGIVAATPGALERIETALAVEWEIEGEPDHADMDAALDIDARLSAGDLAHRVMDSSPEVEGVWDVDLRIDTAFAAHGPIEPRGALASYEEDRLRLWVGSQDIFYVRDYLANALGLNKEQVEVNACRVGGAFGAKTICTVEAEAAVLSRAVRRPVKVQWTRAQEYRQSFHRPATSHRLRASLKEGRIAGWQHGYVSGHILFTSAALPDWMQQAATMVAGDGGVARGAKPPYRIERARVEFDLVRLPVYSGPWRGLGAGTNALAVESAMDEAAHAAGTDPLSFRLQHIEDERLVAVLRRVASIAGWENSVANGSALRKGRGIACGIYKEISYAAAIVDVEVDAEGRAHVTHMWCAHDCGLIINPDQVRAQCEGNLIWGLSMVLHDDLPVRDGMVTAKTFADAPIPRMTDIPEMRIDLIESDSPPGGAGETAIVAAPGAIANAVRAATGRRPVRFPLRPGDFAL